MTGREQVTGRGESAGGGEAAGRVEASGPAATRLGEVAEGARGTVAILSANPIHDTGGGQRSAQLALELLERDFAVVFVSHGMVTETVDLGLRYEHPRLIRLHLDEALAEGRRDDLLAAVSSGEGMVVTQVPVPEWLPLVEDAGRAGATTVYDCIDRWESELGRGWYRAAVEAGLARASGVLTASAPALVDHVEGLTGRETVLLPNAFNARIFDGEGAGGRDRPEAFPEGRRIALYVGALWGGWMDWSLAQEAAAALPETTFVFVGDHRGEGRRLPERCVFTGLLPQAELPTYLAHADVAFLPWRADDVTRATSPLKVYEFVAMGLPVVAPDIEPLRGIPGVRTAVEREAFVAELARTDRASLEPAEREAMRAFARSSSWGERVDRLLELRRAASGGSAPTGHRSSKEGRMSPDRRPSAAGDPDGTAPGPARSSAAATISVVMPAYDHERWVGEALDSVARQSLPPGEIVVVDDGSTDGTAEAVERHGRGPRLIRQANRGAHHALNRAIRLSRGDWIAILNSDDAFEPGRLEQAWGVARQTGAALVCGAVRLIDHRDGPVDADHEIARWYADARAWASSARALSKVLRRHNVAVTTSNFFLHRELWERLGGFRAYRYVHDYDFLLRAVELCPDRIAYEPSLEGVLYRVHPANTITERVDVAAEERRAMMRSLRRPIGRARRMLAGWRHRRALAARVDASAILRPWGVGEAAGPARSTGAAMATEAGIGRAAHGGRAGAARQLRVGLLVDSLGTGGLEEVVALLAQVLPRVGVGTSVLCAREGGSVARRLRAAGIRVTVLRGRLGEASAWAEEERIAAVSSHFAPPDLVSLLARSGVPVVETVQNTYAWLTESGWARERERLEAVAGVIAVSDIAGAYYRQRTGREADWVVPNAVHPARAASVPRAFGRRVLGLDGDGPVFAFVGRVTEQKNPAGLVAAFAEASRRIPDAVLLLVGPKDRSGALGSLRRRHAELFARGAVRHVAPPRHVGTVLSAVDAFVSNAFYEGWSVAASEAAWVGLPLLLSETGGSRALVGGAGERGIVVPNPCGDPLSVAQAAIRDTAAEARVANEEALADAMVTFAGDRSSWRARSGAIRGWARAELGPGVIARRYAEILGGVADI